MQQSVRQFLAALHSAFNQGFHGKVLFSERLHFSSRVCCAACTSLQHACTQNGNHMFNIDTSCQQWNKMPGQVCSQTLLYASACGFTYLKCGHVLNCGGQCIILLFLLLLQQMSYTQQTLKQIWLRCLELPHAMHVLLTWLKCIYSTSKILSSVCLYSTTFPTLIPWTHAYPREKRTASASASPMRYSIIKLCPCIKPA